MTPTIVGILSQGVLITVAMARPTRQKGYELVGCGLYSANGFYVRSDELKNWFPGPHTPERYINPLRYDKIVSFPKSLALPRGTGDR